MFNHDGKPEGVLFPGDIASVGGLARVQGDAVVVSRATFIEPRAWWLFAGDVQKPTQLALNQPPPVDSGGCRSSESSLPPRRH